jgi:4-hydroxy-tetrahydrodipicolinate synthase
VITHTPTPATTIEGIVPVMLTPFHESGEIDYAGLERLIEWYVDHRSDALFAVAQSSEMQFLSLQERADLARFVVNKVAGRVPVVASGHISTQLDDQIEELQAVASAGVQGVVLVTNRARRRFSPISTACSPRFRRICRLACTNAPRPIVACCRTTN